MKLSPASDFKLPRGSGPTIAGEGGLSLRCRSAAEADAELRAAWQSLAEAAAEPNAFQEPWFALAGLSHLGSGRDVRLLEVWEDKTGDRLVGILPLTVAGRCGRVRVRHVRNWRHHHDFLGTPLVRAGREQAFWAKVLTHLDEAAWASGFLHLEGLVEGGPVLAGLAEAAAALGRNCPIVLREVRAALDTKLPPAQYFERTVRKKKRKELKRLRNRLAELGALNSRTLGGGEDLQGWCDDFLALEASGWKGRAGSALACRGETEAFFREAMSGAHAAGRLEMRRLALDGRPIAMLVNFLAPPGSFSFKIAFDEDYARFSPGVLLQIDNLAILDRPDVGWMDSCAAENHPMIESLWGERRTLVRVSVRLAGLRRRLSYAACRAAETLSAAAKPLLPGAGR